MWLFTCLLGMILDDTCATHAVEIHNEPIDKVDWEYIDRNIE